MRTWALGLTGVILVSASINSLAQSNFDFNAPATPASAATPAPSASTNPVMSPSDFRSNVTSLGQQNQQKALDQFNQGKVPTSGSATHAAPPPAPVPSDDSSPGLTFPAAPSSPEAVPSTAPPLATTPPPPNAATAPAPTTNYSVAPPTSSSPAQSQVYTGFGGGNSNKQNNVGPTNNAGSSNNQNQLKITY